MRDNERVDFFVSYSGVEVAWAEWVAYVLEEAGLTTVLQAWDLDDPTSCGLGRTDRRRGVSWRPAVPDPASQKTPPGQLRRAPVPLEDTSQTEVSSKGGADASPRGRALHARGVAGEPPSC